jgi:hypothetical protein
LVSQAHEPKYAGEKRRAAYTPRIAADRCSPVAAGLVIREWRGPNGDDFDLYLRDPHGRLVARATTRMRQKNLAERSSRTGRYTLLVRSYRGSGALLRRRLRGLSPPPSTAPSCCG